MAISVLQAGGAVDQTASATTVVSSSITLSAGSYVEVYVTWDSSGGVTLFSISDTQSLTWSAPTTEADGAADQTNAWYHSTTKSSAATIVVTVTFSSTTGFRGIVVKEIGGSSGYDSTAGAHHENDQASPTTGTDAVTSGNMPAFTSQPALISGFSTNMHGTAGPAAGTGFSQDATFWSFGGSNTTTSENKRVTVTTAAAATFTAGGNFEHTTMVTGFLETIAGGGGLPFFMQDDLKNGFVTSMSGGFN